MFKRITGILGKFGQSALLKEAYATFHEVAISVWPLAMGAVLLVTFLNRRWVPFFINLACALFIAAMNCLILRIRRKHIEVANDLLRALKAENDKFSEFWTVIAAEGGEARVKVTIDNPHGPGPSVVNCSFSHVNPPLRLDQMN